MEKTRVMVVGNEVGLLANLKAWLSDSGHEPLVALRAGADGLS